MPDLDKIDDDDMEQQAKRHLLQPNRRNAEDNYEKKPKNLEPLSIENNPKYPQENKCTLLRSITSALPGMNFMSSFSKMYQFQQSCKHSSSYIKKVITIVVKNLVTKIF